MLLHPGFWVGGRGGELKRRSPLISMVFFLVVICYLFSCPPVSALTLLVSLSFPLAYDAVIKETQSLTHLI